MELHTILWLNYFSDFQDQTFLSRKMMRTCHSMYVKSNIQRRYFGFNAITNSRAAGQRYDGSVKGGGPRFLAS
jgi:hypothetical protein